MQEDKISAGMLYQSNLYLFTLVLVWSTVVNTVLMCEKSCKPKSCLDIYKEDIRNPSGEYVIYQKQQAVRVYCSFEGDYGYTYISRKLSGSTIHMESLFSTREFAKLRVMKSDGIQSEVTVENLPSYKNASSLLFSYNSHENYKGPSVNNNKSNPYLFLGFLPKHLATNRNTQGYRAAATDFTFKNCDSNPNSYITLFLNPGLEPPANKGGASPFMTAWITHATPLQYPHYMDSSFYMDFEMHMGGCGGLMTSQAISQTKAALGLPFALSESEEDLAKICEKGLAMKPPQIYFPSMNPKRIIQCNEDGGKLLTKCDST